MAFNLPPPWDPGFALPGNVRAEGLQRRGFVTEWMPRGTYDQPVVGTGGYAVPQYVMDEGYGQGTFTTTWEPRGEYDGGKIPHWLDKRPQLIGDSRRPRGGRNVTVAVPVSGLGDDASAPQSLADFGEKGAAMIIAQIAQFPAAKRTWHLRLILDKLDPTLWKRTRDIAAALVASGVAKGAAFRQALARALTAGFAAELIRLGQTGGAPQPGSLLGLGSSCAQRTGARGGVGLGALDFSTIKSAAGLAMTDPRGAPPDGSMEIGPLPYFPNADDGSMVRLNRALTQAEWDWVKPAFWKIANGYMQNAMLGAFGSGRIPPTVELSTFSNVLPFPDAKGLVPYDLVHNGGNLLPIVQARHPTTGERYALYMDFDGPPDKPQVTFIWKNAQTVLDDIWDFVQAVRAIIHNIAKQIGNYACELVNKPGATAAAASTGNVYVAGGVVVAQASGLCKPSPTPTPAAVVAAHPWLLPVAIGGAALGAAYLLTRKKKTS